MKILLSYSLPLLVLQFILTDNAKATNLQDYVSGEILVRYKTGVNSINRTSVIRKANGSNEITLGKSGVQKITLKTGTTVSQALNELLNNPYIEYAEPNYIRKAFAVPNDPSFSQNWGLKNTGQTISIANGPDSPLSTNNPGVSGSDMGMVNAWDITTSCTSTIIAVIDSGVNYNHQDLSANMWNGGTSYPKHGYDFVSTDSDPMDHNGHGTHVAGTIAAVGNNSLGGTGVCWTARIMAIRVLDATGSGTTSDIIEGIDFAVNQGAKVINMSLGGSQYSAAEYTALNNAKSAGAIVIAAAGNDAEHVDATATPTSYPCGFSLDNIICVAALTQSYQLASFSNYGTTSVDVGAPGVNIHSTWPGTHFTTPDALTSGWTGTSTTSTGWGYKNLNFGTPVACLVNPTTFNYSSAKYANNTDDRFWKTFNLGTPSAAVIDYSLMFDLENDYDYWAIYARNATGDPVTSGTLLGATTGTSDGYRIPVSHEITNLVGSNTTIGFRLISDSTNNDFGVNISSLSFTLLTWNNSTYNVIPGTSMAAPHVAGLAALIGSYNPNYAYSDIIESIKAGGTNVASLSGKTSTGKAVNAHGSLTYISSPKSLSVSFP